MKMNLTYRIPHDTQKITELERYHDKHEQKEGRAYMLLGIYLDEHLTLDVHINHIVSNSAIVQPFLAVFLFQTKTNYQKFRKRPYV